MALHLHTCKPGFEQLLARELDVGGGAAATRGSGYVLAEAGDAPLPADLCFALQSIVDAVRVRGDSVNALAAALVETFAEHLKGHRVEAPWCLQIGAIPLEGLAGRAQTVRAEFGRRLRAALPRVARFASASHPAGCQAARGFTVLLTDWNEALAGTRIQYWGQRRMRASGQAPSRSFLKIEEAWTVLGAAPGPGETVADLGAAPGGWSLSAAERGAQVAAVDNGPLKGRALGHPRIRHLREDGFRFRPPGRAGFDWLLCDMIEEPHRIVEGILLPWLDQGWCRRFVVNLKVGRHDPVELLRHLRGQGTLSLARRCGDLRLRHLFHDREEITCMGSVSVGL